MDTTLGRVVMERIAELRKWRRWYRAQPDPANWADLAAEHAAELRSLLRLVREARRRPVAERVALAAGEVRGGGAMTWLVDPETREPLPPLPSKERELSYAATHWGTGWRSGFDYENGIPVRMWFAQCRDDCCAEYRANLPPLEARR